MLTDPDEDREAARAVLEAAAQLVETRWVQGNATEDGGPAMRDGCGHRAPGSWGGQHPSLADYLMMTGPTESVDINTLRSLAPPRLRPRRQHVRAHPRARQLRWSRRHSLLAIDPERMQRAIEQMVVAFELPSKPTVAQVFTGAYLPPAADRRLD